MTSRVGELQTNGIAVVSVDTLAVSRSVLKSSHEAAVRISRRLQGRRVTCDINEWRLFLLRVRATEWESPFLRELRTSTSTARKRASARARNSRQQVLHELLNRSSQRGALTRGSMHVQWHVCRLDLRCHRRARTLARHIQHWSRSGRSGVCVSGKS